MPRQRDRTRRACCIARWCGASRVTVLLRVTKTGCFSVCGWGGQLRQPVRSSMPGINNPRNPKGARIICFSINGRELRGSSFPFRVIQQSTCVLSWRPLIVTSRSIPGALAPVIAPLAIVPVAMPVVFNIPETANLLDSVMTDSGR